MIQTLTAFAMFFKNIYHSGCLKRLTLPRYFLPIICIYTCLSLGHCYKQIWCFTPLFSLGFGLVIRMFFWSHTPSFYALLSSSFVWMKLSPCTLISIISGLRDSFPFSSFSGSFLRGERKRNEFKITCITTAITKHIYNGCEWTGVTTYGMSLYEAGTYNGCTSCFRDSQ